MGCCFSCFFEEETKVPNVSFENPLYYDNVSVQTQTDLENDVFEPPEEFQTPPKRVSESSLFEDALFDSLNSPIKLVEEINYTIPNPTFRKRIIFEVPEDDGVNSSPEPLDSSISTNLTSSIDNISTNLNSSIEFNEMNSSIEIENAILEQIEEGFEFIND